MPPSFIKVVLAMLLAGSPRRIKKGLQSSYAGSFPGSPGARKHKGHCGPSGLALVHLACGPLRAVLAMQTCRHFWAVHL